jgi:hypothetical protein
MSFFTIADTSTSMTAEGMLENADQEYHCLQFWYELDNPRHDFLGVFFNDVIRWYRMGSQGEGWTKGEIEFNRGQLD